MNIFCVLRLARRLANQATKSRSFFSYTVSNLTQCLILISEIRQFNPNTFISNSKTLQTTATRFHKCATIYIYNIILNKKCLLIKDASSPHQKCCWGFKGYSASPRINIIRSWHNAWMDVSLTTNLSSLACFTDVAYGDLWDSRCCRFLSRRLGMLFLFIFSFFAVWNHF